MVYVVVVVAPFVKVIDMYCIGFKISYAIYVICKYYILSLIHKIHFVVC